MGEVGEAPWLEWTWNDSCFGTGDVADNSRCIKLGPLGEVFAAKDRHVPLIGEIDRADLEFARC